MASKISAVIITQNEERNIGRCLESLRGIVDETVVVDSGSTDETKEICEKYEARFMHHDWKDYADQKNYANSLVSHEWTLSIDADEALSDKLRESISELKKAGLDGNCTYSMARLNNYCGSWIRHSGWYPDEKVRLWPSGACRWEGLVHEELKYAKAMENRKLEGDLLHYSYYSIEEHASRQVKYATLAAQKAHEQGKRCGKATLRAKTAWTFIRNYVLKGGFRDGEAGYTVCRMAAFYTLIKYTKLRELNKKQ